MWPIEWHHYGWHLVTLKVTFAVWNLCFHPPRWFASMWFRYINGLWQTDRRTDRQTLSHRYTRARIVPRSKNFTRGQCLNILTTCVKNGLHVLKPEVQPRETRDAPTDRRRDVIVVEEDVTTYSQHQRQGAACETASTATCSYTSQHEY